MRAIWSGSINFGLVNIPVKLYSGSQSHEGIDLDMLHDKDKSPIRYARICRKDGKEIPYDHIVKGYEYQVGDYVVLDTDELEKANVKKSKSITIKQFVDSSKIDMRYFDKPYFLEPMKGGEHAYALLRQALEDSDLVALGKFTIRTKDNMGAIYPLGDALVLNQMRYMTDLRNPVDLKFPKEKVEKEELKMAHSLIKQMTKPFIAEDWHDTYTEELEELIEAKVKGKKPKSQGKLPKNTSTKDLMATLKASLK